MIKIKTEPINISNTSLSPTVENRHRKFDAKQAKRHDFGEAHCVVCDEAFTKYHNRTKICSEECRKEKMKKYNRKRYKEYREKILARQREYYAENREKILARHRKYRESNLDEYNARQRARQRKYRENNRDEYNAKQRERYPRSTRARNAGEKKENGNENGKTNIRF